MVSTEISDTAAPHLWSLESSCVIFCQLLPLAVRVTSREVVQQDSRATAHLHDTWLQKKLP